MATPSRSGLIKSRTRRNFLIFAPALGRLRTSPLPTTTKATPSSSVPTGPSAATSIASSTRSPTNSWSTPCQPRPSIKMCAAATGILLRSSFYTTEARECPNVVQPAHASNIARSAKGFPQRQLKSALNAKARDHEHVKAGDQVYFWQDGSGWVRPAIVSAVQDHLVEVEHNGRLNTADKHIMFAAPPFLRPTVAKVTKNNKPIR